MTPTFAHHRCSECLPHLGGLHQPRTGSLPLRIVHQTRGELPFTDHYPVRARIVTFRYDGSVTVAGKGGRPRKWRSDADRVRAYRARQRGDSEPSTLEQAFDDGDELAKALERERVLHEQLMTAQSVERELRASLAAAERELARQLKRMDWLEASQADAAADLAAAQAELDTLREHSANDVSTDRPQRAGVDQQANRAERRRAARRRRA
jgi:hypothetical protein